MDLTQHVQLWDDYNSSNFTIIGGWINLSGCFLIYHISAEKIRLILSDYTKTYPQQTHVFVVYVLCIVLYMLCTCKCILETFRYTYILANG